MEFSVRERKPDAWMFYVICDVSGSMHQEGEAGLPTPWQVMYDGLGDILFEIQESPTARDITHMSVVAFSDDVQEVLPLASLRGDVYIPSLPRGLWTNFYAVFDWLNRAIPRDYDRLSSQFRVKRPALYFITDGWAQLEDGGQDDTVWSEPLKELQKHPCRPIITALGLGQVRQSSLCMIKTAPGEAWIADPGAVPSQLLAAIMGQIIQSVVCSSSGDGFVFEAPRGMRRASCW